MNKLAIVYWSGTGNTQTMAGCIADGAREAGAQVTVMGPDEFAADRFPEFDVVAFGCPAMGNEQLEEGEVEPMFSGLEGTLNGKKIALFGSYGWGDGEWMREWCSRCQEAGAVLYDMEGLIVNEAPDDKAQENCRDLGRKLAAW
ncbi:MAG TPA: flavodoxin [Candidatus Eisenbergiella merdipullorum]|uniref:Flavodoxin n=1 Tax=Candidatus Eisenbergiella merdipullorum TaxID=2838553 RepID=A0A9D2I5Y6_9FIRM|nr:flavodoxin [Candidatus Eisenbergiella merdipullorum]